MPQDYQETLQLDLSPVEFLSQTGHKEEIQKIQSHLASLNFSYPEMHHQNSTLYLEVNKVTPSFEFSSAKTKLSPSG